MRQALFSGAFEPLGRYGIRGLDSEHQTELEVLHATPISQIPIWSTISCSLELLPHFQGFAAYAFKWPKAVSLEILRPS